MEKFARQSINDGVTGVEELSVSRDCELFRALNMHYNKANDFEVSLRPFRLFHTTKQLHSPYQATLYYEVRFKQWCIRYYFESFPLMLAQFKALKLIQLNDLFIWLDNEWQAVHPVSPPSLPPSSPYSWGKVNKNFSLFFWAETQSCICLFDEANRERCFRPKCPCQIQFAELTFTAQLTINICPLGLWSFKHYPYNIIII